MGIKELAELSRKKKEGQTLDKITKPKKTKYETTSYTVPIKGGGTATRKPEGSEEALMLAELKAKAQLESAERLRTVTFKLIQSDLYFDRMDKWNEENVPGFKFTKAPGMKWLRGPINKFYGEVFMENPWTEVFLGDQNTTAMELMRMLMPARSAELTEMVKDTLPKTKSTQPIKKNQIIGALMSAIGTDFAKNPEAYPEIDTENPTSYIAFILEKEHKLRFVMDAAEKAAKSIIPEAQTDIGIIMIDPSTGNAEEIPYGNYSNAAKEGWSPATKSQPKQLGR